MFIHKCNKMKFFTQTLIATFLLLNVVYAQSAKKYFKSAELFIEAKNYKAALESFTKSIELDPAYTDAYVGRGDAYANLKMYKEAIADFEKASAFDTKNETYPYNAGINYMALKQYGKAVEMFTKATAIKKSYVLAYQKSALANIELKEYHKAKEDCENAIQADKKDPWNYYYLGQVLEYLNSMEMAKDSYYEAYAINKRVKEFNLAIAEVKRKLGEYQTLLVPKGPYDRAVFLDQKDPEPYALRGIAYFEYKKYNTALKDLTKAITLNDRYAKAFFYRGQVYMKLGQYQNAINDFTKTIQIKKDYALAYHYKGECFEQIGQTKKASDNYEQFLVFASDDVELKTIADKTKERIYALNKESDKPMIGFIYPKLNEKDPNKVDIPGHLEKIDIIGVINDASKIKAVSVDNRPAVFSKDTLNPVFKTDLIIHKSKSQITIVATDIYDNTTSMAYTINRTEINPPVVQLLAPYSSTDGEVYLDNDNVELYVEGKIEDQSLIKSIVVEGANAGFALNELNPAFTAKINISNKSKFTIIAEDIYGNKVNQDFKINREGIDLAANNPMGKTWVVFIENTAYQNLSSLEGPKEDVRTMKSALANYKINNIVHKKNMSKSDLERFFAIELRDLVRANHVKSLMIWYAGHGKFLNSTGYWIPVDAKKDDEFTYYNINALRAALQSYKDIVHFLTVSDACETGPAFLLAMRGGKAQLCDNWQATKFKSAQAFTSAGFELASDVSVFTKTFAKTLQYNPDACIAIEKIVAKVSRAVSQNQAQAPKFGKISGLEDENGTFFFMKK